MGKKKNITIEPARGAGRSIPRRDFLRILGAIGVGGLSAPTLLKPYEASASGAATKRSASIFPDGIKSGDPSPHRAVIWTRVEAPGGGGVQPVIWSVAEDPSMERIVRGGILETDADNAYHAKVEVRGLKPNRWYYYRFEAEGQLGVVGKLRTAPRRQDSPDHLRYAFASCQQRTQSHYVAHEAIVGEDVDFLMHLGDYIYVSDSGTLTLDDYREVYHRFHSHPSLQHLQANVPLVAAWDDGEFYNGVDSTGDPVRLANARRAWFEAMPLLRPRSDRTHRSLKWGKLAELILLDTRQYRDPEVPANTTFFDLIDAQDTTFPPGDEMFAPGRTTLGKRQKSWLKYRLRRSRAQWKILGSSYDMAPWKLIDYDTPEDRLNNPDLQINGGVYVSNEAWDDYQDERRQIMRHIERNGISNVIVNSGHTHFYKASNIQPDFDDINSPITAMEFVTGSLTADPLPTEIAPIDLLHAAEAIMMGANNPYLRQVDLVNQGYTIVDVTPEETIVEFRVIDTLDPAATPSTFSRFRVTNGVPGIETLT